MKIVLTNKALSGYHSNDLLRPYPYPGLQPHGLPMSADEDSNIAIYDESDRHLKNLLLKLSSNRFIALQGDARVGKSTMIYAGLLPILKKGFKVNGKTEWRIASLIPRQNPMDELAHALVSEDLQRKDDLKNEMLNILNESGSAGIIKAYDRLFKESRENLLIFIDQFDEFFQYYYRNKQEKERQRTQKNNNQTTSEISLNILKAQRFVNQLLEATKQREYPIYILVSMRSSSLAYTGQFISLPDVINKGQYIVPYPKENEIKKGIIKPLEIKLKENKEEEEYEAIEKKVNKLGDKIWDTYLEANDFPLSIIQILMMRAWNGSDKKSFSLEDIQKIIPGENNNKHLKDVINDLGEEVFSNLGTKRKPEIGSRGGVFSSWEHERGKEMQKEKWEEEANYKPQQIICKTIFQHLIQDFDSRGGLKAVQAGNLLALIEDPDFSHFEVIDEAIEEYKRSLKNNLLLGNRKQNKKVDSLEEGNVALDEFDDAWARDSIGRIMGTESLATNDVNSESNSPVIEDVVEVLDAFCGASLLKRYGETDLIDKVGNGNQILYNSYVQITSDILFDKEYGWKKLYEWKLIQDSNAETYSQLLLATRKWMQETAHAGLPPSPNEEGEENNQNDESESLLKMPELGVILKWICNVKPSVPWLTQKDNEFNLINAESSKESPSSPTYENAFEFLAKSIALYERETLAEDSKQKEELRKSKKRTRDLILLVGAACIFAILAIAAMVWANIQRGVADDSRKEAVENKNDANSFAKQALLNEYEAKVAKDQAEIAYQEADSAKDAAIDARTTAINEKKIALREKNRADSLRLVADSTKNEALKKQLLAKAAQIEAEAAEILALFAKRESERLKNIEFIRRRSLDFVAMIDDGQIETARNFIKEMYEDTIYQPLAKDNREFYMALQKLFFNTDALKELYTYQVQGAGGIRTLLPHTIEQDAFIVGGSNGRLAYLKANQDKNQGLKKVNFASIAANEHIRSLAMNKDASRLLVGTNSGTLMGINWENMQAIYTTDQSSNKKLPQLKRLYRESFDDTTIVRDLKYIENNGKLLLQYYQMTNKDAAGNIQDSRSEDKIYTLAFPEGRTFNYKKVPKNALVLPPNILGMRIDAITLSDDNLLIAGRVASNTVENASNLELSSRVYIYDLKDSSKTPYYIQIPPPSSEADINLATQPFITSLEVSPQKNYLAIGKYNGDIYLFRNPFKRSGFSERDSVYISTAHYSQISDFDFSQSDGTLKLAVASYDHTGSLIDVYHRFKTEQAAREQKKQDVQSQNSTLTHKDIFLMKIHQRWMYALKYTSDGTQILTISEDGTARLWYTTVEDTYRRIFEVDEST